ncbi:MAG: glycosyltransferase family 4 protein [Actinomycetota bacterium]|nr:glycosyltransferase family 4 protein [Actinomycetota bacterium]
MTTDVEPALRVAMVCPYDLARPGGVQGQALGLSRALRRMGHEVVVIAPHDGVRGWVTGQAYAVGRSVALRANGSVAPVSVSPLAARRAVDAARDWRADVVHLHEPLAPALGYGFLLSARWPVVATFHRAGVPRAASLAAPATRWMCGRIQVRVAVSEAARRTAAAWCGGRFEVLFNGIDADRFVGARPVASKLPAVVFLGRHEHRKGLGVLLEAFSTGALVAELWVIGSGPETASLRARYPESDRIRWLGAVSDEVAATRLRGASVLCAPSLGGESFGMVLLEGMAARCRVVASDIPGYRDAAGGHATLVPPGDAGALQGALASVLSSLSSPSDAAAIEAAASYAREWSMDRLAQCYVEAYRRAARIWDRHGVAGGARSSGAPARTGARAVRQGPGGNVGPR